MPVTGMVRIDPARRSATLRVELPDGQRIERITGITLQCAEDGAVAAPGMAACVGYQGFERGRAVAWLELPVGAGLPAGHEKHAVRVTARVALEPSAARPLARERVIPEWEATGGAWRPVASASAGGRVAQPFRPTQIPSLLGSPVAYLIVTTDALVPAFQPLADWKTMSGVPAAVRTLSFIRDQYPAAVDDAERIRMFIRDAYTRWGTRWVLLGGDTEILPTRYAHMSFLGDEHIASDLYFSCLDGNWNADGDSTWADGFAGAGAPGDDADLLPEVWVGRAPVVSVADVQQFVAKTLTYQRTPVADYMENVLFFAEVISPNPWSPPQPITFDGAELVEEDELPILDGAPNIHVARMYQNYTDPAWRPGAVQETRAAVLDSLNVGYNVAVHIGHGFRETMSVGDDNLGNRDVHALTNGDRLMNFYAIDCTSNAIDFASIGEALMRAPAGGAVTNIGTTTLDYPAFGRVYQEEYFRVLYEDSVTAVGEAQARQKLPFVGTSYFDGFDRLSQVSLLLLGDPELRIFTARPRELTVTAPGTMTAGAGGFPVTVAVGGAPLYGARVTAWMPGHEYRSALTDGAGAVTLPFHPDSVGPCSLTVTAFNARPWRGTLTVVPGVPAALQATTPVVLDDNLAGRQGDGDGRPDAGEIVDLVVPVRNAGGTGAVAVTGTLSTSDPSVTISAPSADYGTIAPAATESPATGFRLAIAAGCPDQQEVALTLDLAGDGGLQQVQHLQLLVRAPELVHVGHLESEQGGDNDGRPEPGETVSYAFRIRNVGTAEAHGLAGRIRNHDGLATVLDSTFTLPDLAPGAETVAAPVSFVPSNAAARLELSIDDTHGRRLTRDLDLGYPGTVTALEAFGGAAQVRLTWLHDPAADLAGYHVYRATSGGGPFVRISPQAPGRTSSTTDVGLAPLTAYFYQVTAIDSSGNESDPGPAVSAVTGPSEHTGFPIFTRESSGTPVAVSVAPAPGALQDILVGGDVLHLFHPDGTAPVDADGSSGTPGDFTTLGRFYQGGGSFADLDGDGGRDVIGAAWTTQQLVALHANGTPRAGFPVAVSSAIWSSVAVGDLDSDGDQEMVFASLGGHLYAFRANGAEWIDGDGNSGTIGVFKVLGAPFNPGTPALVDLNNSGSPAIVYGSGDGFLYAWSPNGANLPGFPVAIGPVFGSIAIGRLDGPNGPLSIVVPVVSSSIHVRMADGSNRPGFPVALPTAGSGQGSSPALADMNNDGFLDIVAASTDGRIYVFDRNGAPLGPWSAASRFSTLTSDATLAGPVVADINGDGLNDVVVGDENGSLAALSGATGLMLPGFPIAMAAEASGSPALCDCDGDGMSEIVTVDHGGTVHVWNYDFPFSPSGPAPWPQFHQNAQRTGSSERVDVIAVEPVLDPAPRVLELASPHPNPARGLVQFDFGVPAEHQGVSLELAIYDLAGRHVRTLVQGTARTGRAVARWDMRDTHGTRARGGVYLARLSAGAQILTRKVVVLP